MFKKVIGGILILCGIGIFIFSIYLFFTSKNSTIIFALIPFTLFGISLVLAGYGLMTGERIRDILSYLFTGIPY